MHLTLVTEDAPSEAVAEIVLREINADAEFAQKLGRRGIGYISSRLRRLNEAASALKILVIADRDRPANCPSTMISDWIGAPRKPKLVVRFAEMEIESWILADRQRIAAALDVPIVRIPMQPDTVADPKQHLVNIARRSRSSRVREDLCPLPGATNLVGPNYNPRLEHFIRNEWRVPAAAEASPSLARAVHRIGEWLNL